MTKIISIFLFIIFINQAYCCDNTITISGTGTYCYGTLITTTCGKNPVIHINTTEPVIIENTVFQVEGNDIINAGWGTDVTIRNCSFIGHYRNSIQASAFPHALYMAYPKKFYFLNNYLESTLGIYIGGDGKNPENDTSWGKTPEGISLLTQTDIKIKYNSFKNIDGRKSDGIGGYIKNVDLGANAIKLDVMIGVNAEIAWNQIVNTPNESATGDNIVVYYSSGRSSSNPITIHDNFVDGAFPYPANPRGSEFDEPLNGYAGGGILISDGSEALCHINSNYAKYIEGYNNHVIRTYNYGMAISDGHDNKLYNNRIICSGKLPGENTFIPLQEANNSGCQTWNGCQFFAGLYVQPFPNNANLCYDKVNYVQYCAYQANNYYNVPTFQNNIVYGNLVKWSSYNKDLNGNIAPQYKISIRIPCDKLNDNTYVLPQCGDALGNSCSEATYEDEQNEYFIWKQKLQSNNINIGPISNLNYNYNVDISSNTYSQVFTAYNKITAASNNTIFLPGTILQLNNNTEVSCNSSFNYSQYYSPARIAIEESHFNQVVDSSSKDGISIYPNPTDAQVVIKTNNRDAISLEIINTQGESIYSETLNSSTYQTSVNLQNEVPGLYVFKFLKKDKTLLFKVIKK